MALFAILPTTTPAGRRQFVNLNTTPNRLIDSSTEEHSARQAIATATPTKPAQRFASSETQTLPSIDHYENKVYKALGAVNDPLGNQPWEDQINMPVARDIAPGSYTPKVAVLDTGFSLQHEDLQGLWIGNEAESGSVSVENPSNYNCSDQNLPLDAACNLIDDDLDGVVDNESGATTIENVSQLNCSDQNLPLDAACNLIDDDSNGLIDDYIGFDFINYDRSVAPGETDPNSNVASHGTLVAGVLAAINNNNKGIAGSAQNAKILPIQVLDDDGFGYSVSVADGIVYATDLGVDIINMSLGSSGDDPYLRAAIDYATKNGVIIVAASGNDNCDCVSFPAAYSPVLAVGAVDNNGNRASFSNYGNELDITAPGVMIASSAWSTTNAISAYAFASGTSFTAPITAGIVANIMSHLENANPIQIKALVSEQANKSMLGTSEIKNSGYGFGILDASSSVVRTTTPYSPAQLTSFANIRSGQSYLGSWIAVEEGSTSVYQCEGSQKPTTPVFKITGSNKVAFTSSESESETAKDNGFSITKMFDTCVLMPHDTPSAIRTINTHAEFTNATSKRDLD